MSQSTITDETDLSAVEAAFSRWCEMFYPEISVQREYSSVVEREYTRMRLAFYGGAGWMKTVNREVNGP